MERKEVIEILNKCRLEDKYGSLPIYEEAKRIIISDLELLDRFGEGEVEKKVCKHKWITNWKGGDRELTVKYDPNYFECKNCGIPKVMPLILTKSIWVYNKGFNSAIDLCNAHFVRKTKGIEDVIIKILRELEPECNFGMHEPLAKCKSKKISQAIITHLTGGNGE